VGHLLSELPTALLRRRGALLPFAPVFFGIGIGGYFALSSEPLWWPWAMLAGLCMLAAWRMAPGWGAVLIALGMALAGLSWASVRAQSVAAPVLEGRYYGPIEGRIVAIDRSASDAVRLTLDRVSLPRLPRQAQPARVRVSLYGEQGHFTPEPGARVALTGHLAPPGGPVEPGGFDFQRHSWFLQLGGVGYTRSPVMLMQGAEGELWLYRLRVAVSDGLRRRIPRETGAVAAAIVTGDRSAISQQVVDQLRATNLAHLLAISGLHMGLLAGFLFWAVRAGLALLPRLAMRLPAKTLAAAVALAGATGYLALSGSAVATERAYVMVAVALLAVMIGRRALSLRAVAIAALIVLTLTPEALVSPGFQMSFAATTALVAVFGALRDRGGLPGPR
jgi:competence protein ComEC